MSRSATVRLSRRDGWAEAEIEDDDEHRSALLHAAARWIDESGRDLRAVLAEGNFRKVFPFAPEVAAEAEKALEEAET